MQSIENVVICAAGMGSRLGLNTPKCLVKIDGKSIIEYILDVVKEIENVRIVVGFMEKEVMEHVVKIRHDVIFVRNPHFRETTNSFSLSLGSKGIQSPFLIIDGDTVVDKNSLIQFTKSFDGKNNLIGVTKTKTEEAVFVNTNSNGEVISFQRQPSTPLEWSGIAIIIPPFNLNDGYVYNNFDSLLPLPYKEVKCFEVDTPYDLEKAKKNIKNITTY